MIALLIGTLEHIDDGEMIILAGQVGYSVSVSTKILGKWSLGDEVRLWIYHHQTEAGSRLIGFQDLEEKQLFIRLLTVN